jgi:tetratricopeptide (TPR) repeat protein
VMQARFYRPLLTVWFLINKTLFGLNPHGFHGTTVLAHVAATGLAYFVARAILKDAGAALFAAAIFGLHPLQVESASWISAVNDPLAAMFCFGSFLLYRKAGAEKKSPMGWWALASALFLGALLTKEVSMVLPGIILVDLWSKSKERGEAAANASARFPVAGLSAFAAVGVAWLLLRSSVLGGVAAAATQVPGSTILLSAPKIFLFNLYRVIAPVGLSPQYDLHLIESVFSAQFVLAFLALVAVASIAIAAAGRDARLWVAFAWIVLPLLPTLNLAWMNEDDFIHDRYLYMSMLGIALLAGAGYGWLRRKWPQLQLLRSLAGCLVIVLAFASAVQSQIWANDVVLFSRAASRAPGNEWAQLNYGSALSSRGKYADAAPHFVRSYELKPGWRAADFAGFAYQQAGDLAEAEQWFNAALKFNPDLASAWFGLGQIRLAQHLPDEAIPDLRKAIAIEPSADGFHYEMGAALEAISQPSAAAQEYRKELDLHPYQIGAQKALERVRATNVPGAKAAN